RASGARRGPAVFASAHAAVIRPRPHGDPSRLAVVDVAVPFVRLDDWRARLSMFEHVTGYTQEGFSVRGLGEPRFVPVAIVDDTFFETLESAALAGRTLVRGDSAGLAV